MQALYFCVPFREQLLEYYANNKSITDAEENLLTCLADLFSQVTSLIIWKILCFPFMRPLHGSYFIESSMICC